MKAWAGSRGGRFKRIPISILIISCYCALSGLNDTSVLIGYGSYLMANLRVGALSPLYAGLMVIEPLLFFAAAYTAIRLRSLCIVLMAASFASVWLRFALSGAALERGPLFVAANVQMHVATVQMIFISGIALIFLGYTTVLWRRGTLA